MLVMIATTATILFTVQQLVHRFDVLRDRRHAITENAIGKLVDQIREIQKTNGLPATEAELGMLLAGWWPLDGWGRVVHYQLITSNRFVVSAMSPWPEVLVFHFGSTDTGGKIQKYLF